MLKLKEEKLCTSETLVGVTLIIPKTQLTFHSYPARSKILLNVTYQLL